MREKGEDEEEEEVIVVTSAVSMWRVNTFQDTLPQRHVRTGIFVIIVQNQHSNFHIYGRRAIGIVLSGRVHSYIVYLSLIHI